VSILGADFNKREIFKNAWFTGKDVLLLHSLLKKGIDD
jgi:hypothetical protein